MLSHFQTEKTFKKKTIQAIETLVAFSQHSTEHYLFILGEIIPSVALSSRFLVFFCFSQF